MKKHFLFLFTIGSLFFISATHAVADESLYVQPFRAKIFTKPSIASEVLGSVDSGFRFVSTGREGSWVKIPHSKVNRALFQRCRPPRLHRLGRVLVRVLNQVQNWVPEHEHHLHLP